MAKVMDRRPEGKLKERGFPLIAVVLLSGILALSGLTLVIAVLATQPL